MTDALAKGSSRRLSRLLRFLLASGRARVCEEEGGLRLSALDGRTFTVEAALVRDAARSGLVLRQGDAILPAPEARNALRRMLAEGEAFPAQHGEIEPARLPVDGATETVRINRSESPLAALARMRDRSGAAFLPDIAIAAGERLAADFQRAGLQPRVTMSWEPRLATRSRGEAGKARDLCDSALAARTRVGEAVAAMGPELSGVALDVCCFAKGLETVERERQWPVRSAKLMLRTALMALARHYDPPRRPTRRQGHAWGAEGYRPEAGGIVVSE